MVDFNQLLKEAQGMQKKIQEIQQQMANNEYIGKSGGGLINVKISGCGKMRQIEIDNSLLTPDEKDILQDLIVAAFNDAKQRADQDAQNSTSGAFSNMGLPAGFKMPF